MITEVAKKLGISESREEELDAVMLSLLNNSPDYIVNQLHDSSDLNDLEKIYMAMLIGATMVLVNKPL